LRFQNRIGPDSRRVGRGIGHTFGGVGRRELALFKRF